MFSEKLDEGFTKFDEIIFKPDTPTQKDIPRHPWHEISFVGILVFIVVCWVIRRK